MKKILSSLFIVSFMFFIVSVCQATSVDEECNAVPNELNLAIKNMCEKPVDTQISLCNQLKETYKNNQNAIARIENRLGIIFFEQKDYEKARQHLEIAYAIDPTLVRTNIFLGRIEAARKSYDTALEYYKVGIDNETESAVLSDLNYFAGRACFEKKDYTNGIQFFSQAINYGGQAQEYEMRGRCFAELKDFSSAIRDYNKAIDIKPNFSLAYFNRGIAYVRIEKFNDAIQDYKNALELNGEMHRVHFHLGYAYSKLNNHSVAVEEYTKYLYYYPNDAEAYYNRGLNCYHLADYQTAIENFSQAILLNTKHGKAYKMRGMSYRKIGAETQALQDFNRAKQLGVN